MRSPNNATSNQFDDHLNLSDHYLQIAQNFAEDLKLELALFYCGLALQQYSNNLEYAEFYRQICHARAVSYETTTRFAIAEFRYRLWTKQNTPQLEELRHKCQQLAEIKHKPTISLIVTETITDTQQISNLLRSLQEQVYPHWQLLVSAPVNQDKKQTNLAKDNQHCQLQNFIQEDQRIQIIPHNSQLTYLQKAITLSTNEWLALIKAETFLTPIALFEFIQQLQQNPELDLAYGDEDQLNKHNYREQPWFKPNWSPELFLARNYFNSLVFIRRDLALEIIEDISSENEHDYVYDLLLRASEKTSQICHISQILTHIQKTPQQENHSTQFSNCQLIQKTLQRRGEIATVNTHQQFADIHKIRYQLQKSPLVSIIIPSKNLGLLLDRCLQSIFSLSTYQNYEVILIDNGSKELDALAIIKKWQQNHPEQLRVLKFAQPFNYSQLNNFGVRQARGEYLLFLNNDIQVITPDWLESMVEQAQRKQIGAVGAMLIYSDQTIQHAGVILGVTGIAGHSHRHYHQGDQGYYQYLLTTNNVTAVTGACLMCSRDRFEQVGGFNEQLAVAYNDVDFCLKLHQQGYQNLWLPHVQLYHYESQTRTPENTPAKQRRIQQEVDYMQTQWGELIAQDPFYNRHLAKDKEDFSLNVVYEFRVASIDLALNNQDQVTSYFIDQPQLNNKSDHNLEIVGWVIGKVTRAIAIKISCQDHLIAEIPIYQQRPDVATAFPQIPTAIHSGFATTIDLSQINLDKLVSFSTSGLKPRLELLLTAVFADHSSTMIASIKLTC